MLPKEFRPFFERAGLDIDAAKFRIRLPKDRHILKPNGIHTNLGGNWNRQWQRFFDKYPDASKKQILRQLRKMRRQFRI